MPTIQFEQSDEPLDSWELTHFLYLFRAAYAHSLAITPADEEEVARAPERYAEIFRSSLPSEEPAFVVAELFDTDHEREDLRIARISKESPLQIAFYCVVSALTLSVIVSGGKVDASMISAGKADVLKLRFRLPPLGVGIKSLRDAFKLRPGEKKKKGRTRR